VTTRFIQPKVHFADIGQYPLYQDPQYQERDQIIQNAARKMVYEFPTFDPYKVPRFEEYDQEQVYHGQHPQQFQNQQQPYPAYVPNMTGESMRRN
jgi:hypothetical protein